MSDRPSTPTGSSSSISTQSYPATTVSPPSSPGASSVQSLPSSPSSTELESSEESDAEQQWKESIQQLELLLSMVIIPYAGKYFGRRAAYWVWGRYMEWHYPVKVSITSPGAFKGAGAVEAAASL